MATMTVWKFGTAEGAEAAEAELLELQKRGLITVHDAAVVSYPVGARKPKTKQLHSVTGAMSLGGAFWGLLFGLIFLVPLLGAAIGAGMGALAGSMTDIGIDDDFITKVRAEVQPGTSALFLLSSDAVVDKVREEFKHAPMTLLETNLSKAEEEKLREVFAE
jgi:uncharacterized membrane protein